MGETVARQPLNEAIPQLSLGDDGQPMPRFGACAHLDDLQADSPHVRRERLSTPSEAYMSASVNYEIALRKMKRIRSTLRATVPCDTKYNRVRTCVL